MNLYLIKISRSDVKGVMRYLVSDMVPKPLVSEGLSPSCLSYSNVSLYKPFEYCTGRIRSLLLPERHDHFHTKVTDFFSIFNSKSPFRDNLAVSVSMFVSSKTRVFSWKPTIPH